MQIIGHSRRFGWLCVVDGIVASTFDAQHEASVAILCGALALCGRFALQLKAS
jgi:hypothetical protein